MSDTEPTQEVPVHVANEARFAYLASQGIRPPLDQMYATSLLEFLVVAACGPDGLAQAKEFHEARIAPILDKAVSQLTHVQEAQRSEQIRRTLLEGI